MNYYVELQKNTQTTNCVKQIKEFTSLEEANNYLKNALLELEPENRGFIELGEYKIYYKFISLNEIKSIKINKEDLKKSDFFIENHLISNSTRTNNFFLTVKKIRISMTKIEF